MIALPLPSTACQPLWFEDQHASAVHAEPGVPAGEFDRLQLLGQRFDGFDALKGANQHGQVSSITCPCHR
jgi:hypothetical protein